MKMKSAFGTVAAVLLCASNLNAQVGTTNLPPVPTPTGAPAPTVWGQIKQVGINLYDGFTSLTNVTGVGFGEYCLGPKRIGGGLFVTDWMNQYVGAGIGMEYIGAFYGLNVNLALEVPTQPFQKLTWAPTWVQTISVTPNAIAALETPLAGGGNSNGGVGTLAGGGASIGFASWQKMFGVIKLPGSCGAGYDYLNRTGAGKYDGGNHTGFFWLTIR